MDETCVEVKFIWKQLYCVVDRTGQDRTGQDRTGQDRTGQARPDSHFLLASEQDMSTSLRFFEKAMRDNGILEKVAIGEGGTNKVATDKINAQGQSQIFIRQMKCLNHLAE